MPDDLVISDDAERRVIARRVCLWELGNPTWADIIIDAYLFPSTADWGEEDG